MGGRGSASSGGGGKGGGAKGAAPGAEMKGATASMAIADMDRDAASTEMARLSNTETRARLGQKNKEGIPYSFTTAAAERLAAVTKHYDDLWKTKNAQDKVTKDARLKSAWGRK